MCMCKHMAMNYKYAACISTRYFICCLMRNGRLELSLHMPGRFTVQHIEKSLYRSRSATAAPEVSMSGSQ